MDGSANNSSSVLCHYVDERHADVICDGIDFHRELHLKPTQLLFWGYVAIYVCLVLFAGKLTSNEVYSTLVPSSSMRWDGRGWC